MARLKMVIDNKAREEVIDFVMRTLKEEEGKFSSITFGHISENGLHIQIEGEKAELEKIKTAFEKNKETAIIFE